MPRYVSKLTGFTPAPSLPDGPVSLWIAAFGLDGGLLGAGPLTQPVTWLWRGGNLHAAYGTAHLAVVRPGWYHVGRIIAVSERARKYVTVFTISLGEPREVRLGQTISVVDGVIKIVTDPDRVEGSQS